MATLQFDVEALEKMSASIQEAIETLEKTLSTKHKYMENLKKEWNTPAGKKFFKENDVDFDKSVKDYIITLKTLKAMLDDAAWEYDIVRDAWNRLDLPRA